MNKHIFLLFALVLFTCCNSKNLYDPTVIPAQTQKPNETVHPIVIVGAGAAGTMAVKRALLNNNKVLLFTGATQERRRSRGNWVRKVDNIPGLEKYNRTVLELRNEVLADLKQGPFSSNLCIIEDSVVEITKEKDQFTLKDSEGSIYYGTHVVLATGIMDEQPHIQGSIRPVLNFANGQTIAYCLICDGHRSINKPTVVIGHSKEAVHGALLLSKKYDPPSLTLLTNGKPLEFSEELESKNISICASPILEVLGDAQTKQLEGFKLESGESIQAKICFVMLGIRPNNQLALQLGAAVDDRGLVIADDIGETTIKNLYVIGDLRANSMKQIYTAWQHAVDCLQAINQKLRSPY